MSEGVRVLAAGVDSLYTSIRGELVDGLTTALAATKELPGDDPKVVCYRESDGNFLLRSHGWRGYPFWLSCPRFELFIGAIKPFPPAYVALHSPYIHTVGIDGAVADLTAEMTEVYFAGEVIASPSRVDVYADVQGWQPVPDDFDRFACRGVRRRLYEQPRELHGNGRALSGFTFGKGAVVARIYDKTREMATRNTTWQETIWSERNPEMPVWRVEFQFRRKALTSFGISTIGALLNNRQALWEYGCQWLSLRVPTSDPNRSRWPEAAEWQGIRAAVIGSPASPLVRERIQQADERRLVSGFVGYASSLAAMNGGDDIGQAVRNAVPMARHYLDDRGVQFRDVVRRKRDLRSTGVRARAGATR